MRPGLREPILLGVIVFFAVLAFGHLDDPWGEAATAGIATVLGLATWGGMRNGG